MPHTSTHQGLAEKQGITHAWKLRYGCRQPNYRYAGSSLFWGPDENSFSNSSSSGNSTVHPCMFITLLLSAQGVVSPVLSVKSSVGKFKPAPFWRTWGSLTGLEAISIVVRGFLSRWPACYKSP